MPPLSRNVIITSKEPQVTLEVMGKQIQFLLDTGATYSVLPAFVGKLSMQTTIVMGVEGQQKLRNFTPSLTCQFEDQVFLQEFLIAPSSPVPLLGRDILTKLGAILQFKYKPPKLLILQGSDNIPKHINQHINPHTWYNDEPGKAKSAKPVKFNLRILIIILAVNNILLSQKLERAFSPL